MKTIASPAPKALAGIRVLDLTVALAGPYCTLLLAGLGAEVIKIESPGGGDIARTNPPFYGEHGPHFDTAQDGDISLTILARARNKKSITLDLKSEKGRQIFRKLVRGSDIVVENLSDGAVERLTVDYDSLKDINPRLIYCSISGVGRPNPYPGLKVMDIIAQALSGVMDVTGEEDGPPARFGLPIADLLAPLYGLIGIEAALVQRERTGEGQHIVVSMTDSLASLLPFEHFDIQDRFGFPPRSGNHQKRLAPFGTFTTTDGYVAIAGANQHWVAQIFDAIGHSALIEDPRFCARGQRAVNADTLNAAIESWTRRHSTASVIAELQVKRGVPCAPVRTVKEVLADPRLQASGALQPLFHPEAGQIDAVGAGVPIRMSGSTVGFDKPAPMLGADNENVFGSLAGLSDIEIARLKTEGVI
ncbi:CaiB/BaiF CoA-transferase family protein [Bosea sp. ASV33]|uniref:CaiB/BaiF CoA transferase family protein n=1 Tax=Bosea sp. ASV33 TaxID=2795106 RepID=UPI0018EC5CED|nr:CaiB/BaiF CoA-transferase family protein [Bosea sp. ASV33]